MGLDRFRPTSIRARYTLLVTVIAALVSGLGAVGMDIGVRRYLAQEINDEALRQARRISDQERAGRISGPIPVSISQIDLVQVVGADGRVIAASAAAAGRPPLSRFRPKADDRVTLFQDCPWPGTCVMGAVIRASSSPGSRVIYAARREPIVLATPILEISGAALLALVLAAVAAFTWRVVGRTLRPVTEIRREMAEITGSDLSRRINEPRGGDEIAQLARTANRTIDRLQQAVYRQRGFASDASHELRTPIAGMRAQIETALMYPEDTDLLEAMRAVGGNLDRLESIITDLLLLTRLGTEATGDHETLDLGALIGKELTHWPRPRVPVDADLPAGVEVDGSPVQLARMFGNLFDNAERHADSLVHIVVRREGDQAVLEVCDDGDGVAPQDWERVFERFTRLDAARSRDAGGTGLGLALVRDIATAHDGTVGIEPSPRGARFVLRIPAHPR